MMTQYFKIKALVIDGDEAKFKISVGNENVSSSIEIFGYIDEFNKFGEELINFPKDSNDVCQYELGKGEEEWAYYLLIKIFCYEPSGQTAIQISMNNKKKVPELVEANFYLQTYPTSINKLGKSLSNWKPDKVSKLECSIEDIN